jgi:DNA mismatch repair protein MutS
MSCERSRGLYHRFLELKSQELNPDVIVFVRAGDFYETYDDDAELIAKELGVTLTSRPVTEDKRVPMAGFSYWAGGGYFHDLIKAGYKLHVDKEE